MSEVNQRDRLLGLAKSSLIVALDVNTEEEVRKLVSELSPYCGCFKVGLELINSIGGPQVVALVKELGGQVFYDIKLHDIPNTVMAAARSISKMRVRMFNLHACAGPEAIEAAVEGAEKGTEDAGKSFFPLILAVTVLTSIGEEECNLIYGAPVKAKVLQFARDVKRAGAHGFICSPKELEFLCERKEFVGLQKITPGVRPAWAALGDQKRVMTPAEAILAGADAVVIGRPILKPPSEFRSSVEAAQAILEEMSHAFARKEVEKLGKS